MNPRDERLEILEEDEDCDEEDDDEEFSSEDEELLQKLGLLERREDYGSERIPMPAPPPTRRRKYPREVRKTLGSFLFMICNFLATTTSLSIIHEQRPMYEPLPDQILDRLPHQARALDISEIILQIMTLSTILLVIFHKYRMIVLRRIFFILGLLYGYRAITMFVTVLPSSDPGYHCAPKLVDSGRSLTVKEVIKRVFKILSGFGLSINGRHVYCGDFIYSGHTMIATLCYLVIVEYTDRRWYLFHYLVWLLAVFAVGMLMLARGHYSIDVIIAYYVTTRLFWLYHSIAYHEPLKKKTEHSSGVSCNHFQRIWWWRMLSYFERNVDSTPLPNAYSFPIARFRPRWLLVLLNKLSHSSNSHSSGISKRIRSKINNIKNVETNP